MPAPYSRARRSRYFLIFGILGAFALAALMYYSFHHRTAAWSVYYPGIGTGSSPRVADLNGDGIPDVVLGAGAGENHRTDVAVLALNGRNGQLLWRKSARNQLVGSAVFKDINADGTPDVFIGGRTAELLALNGRNGELLWEFFPQGDTVNAARTGWYNFYTPQFIPDQDGDGLEDLLIANGGDNTAAPHDPNRPVGRLLVLSSRSGKILANATMPDGRETYMSAVWTRLQPGAEPIVLFGTGGETIGGHLYRLPLKELLQGDLSRAVVLDSSATKGFIAPPVLVDLTGDGTLDIIANAVEGRIVALNGKDNAVLWRKTVPGTEAYSTPALGYFNGDDTPDVFINYGIGVWPAIGQSVEMMLDGKTGAEAFRDTIGRFQYASPVVADLNADGYDEVVLTVNQQHRAGQEVRYYTQLIGFDFKSGKSYPLLDTLPGTNLASTPWVGDLDQDHQLEVITSSMNLLVHNNDLTNPSGLHVALFKIGPAPLTPVTWGAYQGSQYDGIFRSYRPARASSAQDPPVARH